MDIFYLFDELMFSVVKFIFIRVVMHRLTERTIANDFVKEETDKVSDAHNMLHFARLRAIFTVWISEVESTTEIFRDLPLPETALSDKLRA